MTIHRIQSRSSSHVARKLVLHLTRVKVKVVRIARRVKVKYVIKAILPAPAGLSRAWEGASLQAGPLSHRSRNYVSLGWEFADCFYIWKIPGDHRQKHLGKCCAKVGAQQ